MDFLAATITGASFVLGLLLAMFIHGGYSQPRKVWITALPLILCITIPARLVLLPLLQESSQSMEPQVTIPLREYRTYESLEPLLQAYPELRKEFEKVVLSRSKSDQEALERGLRFAMQNLVKYFQDAAKSAPPKTLKAALQVFVESVGKLHHRNPEACKKLISGDYWKVHIFFSDEEKAKMSDAMINVMMDSYTTPYTFNDQQVRQKHAEFIAGLPEVDGINVYEKLKTASDPKDTTISPRDACFSLRTYLAAGLALPEDDSQIIVHLIGAGDGRTGRS